MPRDPRPDWLLEQSPSWHEDQWTLYQRRTARWLSNARLFSGDEPWELIQYRSQQAERKRQERIQQFRVERRIRLSRERALNRQRLLTLREEEERARMQNSDPIAIERKEQALMEQYDPCFQIENAF